MTHNIIPVPPFDYIIFGITGDLCKRKLIPALYHRFIDGQIPESSRIIGCARSEMNRQQMQNYVQQILMDHFGQQPQEQDLLEKFVAMIDYVRVDIKEKSNFHHLKKFLLALNSNHVRVFYLSVGPSLYADIVDGLQDAGLNCKHQTTADDKRNPRLVVEKPFGFDERSARELNHQLANAFDEHAIYRIDHFLGKEAVQNLMALRFANAFFEPLWNNHYVDHIQIAGAESLGLEGRGGYYDNAGAMRDMVQNHLLQMLCLTAMEPPFRFQADGIRDEKLKVLKNLKPLEGLDALNHSARGQYLRNHDTNSYFEDVNNPSSKTESYVAIRVEVNNWRWAGTPFYLRTGKRLRANMTEIAIIFKDTPHSIFAPMETPIKPNALIIRLQPDEGIDLSIMTKDPGPGGFRLRQTSLDTSGENLNENIGRMPEAYERLILDVVRGDQTLFMRSDEVETAWQWVDPIIQSWKLSGEAPEAYDPGTQGPDGAVALLARSNRRWRSIV